MPFFIHRTPKIDPHEVQEVQVDPRVSESSSDLNSRKKRTRLSIAGVIAILSLGSAPFARQEMLNRRLEHAIIANQDKEALRALEEGADAKALYYHRLPSDWWSRLCDALVGRREWTAEGTPLLVLALENQPVKKDGIEFMPPTPDRVKLMETLVKKGTPVNVNPWNGMTPLDFAIISDSYDLAVCLLDHGADVKMRGMNRTPLSYALQQPDRRIFFAILNRMPDIHDENPQEWLRVSVPPEYTKVLQERYAKEHPSR